MVEDAVLYVRETGPEGKEADDVVMQPTTSTEDEVFACESDDGKHTQVLRP